MPHITFIHGISNKPEAAALHDLWLRALARENGPDCTTEGITSSMVYWADVMYPAPETTVEPLESANEENEAQLAAASGDDSRWRHQLPPDESAFVESLAARLGADLPEEVAPATESVRGKGGANESANLEAAELVALEALERIPLPWAIKRPLMKRLLRDVHHYLFNVDFRPRPGQSYRVQEEIRTRFVAKVKEGARNHGPHVVVSHSMGTVIAYDCLKRVPECPEVDALFTLGSPLGLDEIQDKLKPEWRRDDGFPDKVGTAWVNVFDRLDPVAGFDPSFADDYLRHGQQSVEDIHEPSWGKWRHSITKYLYGAKLRSRLTELLQPQ
ncbi:MAG TPA: hypothetical protein VHM24_00240 [Gemmatimonadaceae bacterium]|nr:hypothetical protein [Gemmatimonadaceae bacterium]